MQVTDLSSFPPTVESHTTMTDGMRLHTIDPMEERDIDIYDDPDEPPVFADNSEGRPGE